MPATPHRVQERLDAIGVFLVPTQEVGGFEVDRGKHKAVDAKTAIWTTTARTMRIYDAWPRSARPRPQGGDLSESLPQGVILFYDDERGFFDWLDQNLDDGFFLNTARNPSTGIPMLHRASCGHIGRLDSWEYTKTRAKLCSLNRRDLEHWALQRVGTDPVLCQTCFG